MLCFCDLPKLHVPFFRNSSLLLLSLLSYVGIIVQVLNGHPYNRKCDVYSFGICLWEIYCCDMPYPDLSFSEVTSAVVRQVNKKKRRPIPFSPLHLSDSWTLKHWKEKSPSLIDDVLQNLRPEIPRCCPSSLANVMKRCWDANPDKRPEMAEVVCMLEAIDTSKGGGMIPTDQPQGCFSCFGRHRGPWRTWSDGVTDNLLSLYLSVI